MVRFAELIVILELHYVHDVKVRGALLHGEETRVYGDQAIEGKAT